MSKRELLAGGIGAALTALVLVGIQQRVAGGSSPRDVRGQTSDPGTAAVSGPTAQAPSDEAWRAANANLTEMVRTTEQRLQKNEAEKKGLERELKVAKARLAAESNDGAPPRNEFDLTQEDWKQLAKTGTVKSRYPCNFDPNGHIGPEQQTSLGLSPADSVVVEKAVKDAESRIAKVIVAGCAKVLGDASLAQKLGPRVCTTVIGASVRDQARDNQLVADIRAGNVAMPPADAIDPLAAMMLAQTSAMKELETDLAASFGPAEAHRLAFADELGSCSGTSGPP